MRTLFFTGRRFAKRDLQPELMDDPALDPEQHRRALKGLQWVNRLSRSAAILWPAIRGLVQDMPAERPLRILDLACGGGDVTRAMARRALRADLPIHIDGCDVSALAVEHAAQSASLKEQGRVHFFRLDVLQEDLPRDYDVLMCSLFLHHLSRDEARRMLRRMADAAQKMVLINDLRRTRRGYVLAYAGCRLLSRSPIVHHDGPASVRAAFTSEEIRRLAREANLDGAQVTHHWPQRLLLSWRKPA